MRGAHGSAWLLLLAAVAASGCRKQTLDTSTPPSAVALSGSISTADPATLAKDDGQWVMPAKDYSSTRFSGLDEINTTNVRRLGVA